MADNIFGELAEAMSKASKSLAQLAPDQGWKKTVIVHPQLGQNAEEAEMLAEDWGEKEKKQLMDNVSEALG